MTRKQLIKAINDNEDAWSCPEYSCDMPEEEGNTGECCCKCAEKQLKEYEDKIRADAIEGVMSLDRYKFGVTMLAAEEYIKVSDIKQLKDSK